MTTAKKKKQLRSKLDKLWYQVLIEQRPDCEVCGNKAVQIHHYYYKSSYGHLRYDLDNGISLCQSCHFKLHFCGNPDIQQKIVEKRGKEWHDSLTKKARKKIEHSYQTIGYYESVREKLNEVSSESN